jgi:predicted DsbA family dithiol-disulfide isomerase
MQVDIWSDVVCPWCYVGKRRFEKALARFEHASDVVVRWHSFELDPSAERRPVGTQAQRLAAKYGRSEQQAQVMLDTMTATAADEGLSFSFDLHSAGNTFDAHRLLHLAAARGRQDQLKERLLRAVFTEGEATSEHDVLTRLAVEVGLDEDEVTAVLSTDVFADEVRADEETARSLGITGVPFFVVDMTYGVSGAQSPEVLLDVLDKAWAEANPLTVVATGGEACEGDSCAV